MTTHRLAGLETDNLLGFLALLGLLRALERSKADWEPRAYFGGTPLSAHLELAGDASEDEVAQAASDGCSAYSAAFTFDGHNDLTFGADTARQLLEEALASEDRAEIMSALFSDGAVKGGVKGKEDRVIATPLCAMFGQGHQSFLSRLQSVSHGNGKEPGLNDPHYIRRALFAPWDRKDHTESFRWDFAEDRRYALRYRNPSADAPTTEHGANRLALLGLLSFQSAPVIRGLRADLATRAVLRGTARGRRTSITWPVWHTPASLDAIHAMLDHPDLVKEKPGGGLRRYGIDQVRRVYRISVGKFLSFSRAETIALSKEKGDDKAIES